MPSGRYLTNHWSVPLYCLDVYKRQVGEEYEGRVILDKALNKVDQIKLSYEQNMFSEMCIRDRLEDVV